MLWWQGDKNKSGILNKQESYSSQFVVTMDIQHGYVSTINLFMCSTLF